MTEKDVFQERYLAHQERKKRILTNNFGNRKWKVYTPEEQQTFLEVLRGRCSQRSFNREDIDITPILEAITEAPSSCDRHGILTSAITQRDEKDLLSGLLVGGVGWINRANTILLLKADMDCYKSPAEKDNMPYLDAGVIIQTVYLTAEVMNIGCCYVNPNIRDKNKDFFYDRFDIKENEVFCGALALGKFDFKHNRK
ncbi:TPA: hypothetical protein DEP90_01660 [Patescibacteria group bacterium]|nr:hypothetical protein [Patescibacteria group bacterium]